ncbi:MAG: DUF1009 family protein [Verrucomicrobiales bacterium]
MSHPGQEHIGIIAGNGIYPRTFARAARRAGVQKLAVVAFLNETEPSLADEVDVIEWLRVGQLSKLIKFFQREAVTSAVMVGQIAPRNLFDLRPDVRTMLMLGKLRERNAESIFGAIAGELEKDGIKLLPATTFLDDHLPKAGHVCGPKMKDKQRDDAEFGMRIAREMSRLDVGQTVVVKNGTVLAVEAFEGTNDAIKRGGELGKGGATIAKVSKPNQDFRFDVPVVGPQTIQAAAGAGVGVIVVEAERTLLLGLREIHELCDQSKVTLVAMNHASS